MSLLVDDVELQQRPHLFFWVAQGLDELPEARGEDLVMPGIPGRAPGRWVNDVRTIEIRGWIEGYVLDERSPTDLRAQLDTIKRLLDPSRRVPATIRHLAEDGEYRTIRARPRDVMPQGRTGQTPDVRILSIALTALDPAWSGVGGIPLDAGYALDEGESLDAGIEIVVAPTSTSQELEVVVVGTARPRRIRCRFTGSATSAPGLENLTLPEGVVGFTVTGSLSTSGELLVDTYERKVERNGTNVRLDMSLRAANQAGEYIALEPGVNTLRILGRPNDFRLRYTPEYL